MVGHNNNPTARQFRSAYKKLVIRQYNIKHFNTGSDPIKVINNSSNNNYDVNVSEVNSVIHNNFYQTMIILLAKIIIFIVIFQKK